MQRHGSLGLLFPLDQSREQSPARYTCGHGSGAQPGEGTRAWTLKFGRSGLESIDHTCCVALGSVQSVFRLPLHSHSPSFTPLSVLLGLATGELPEKEMGR